jgi:hypothetical protein
MKETVGKNRVAVPSVLRKIIYDPSKEEAIAFFTLNKPLKTYEIPKRLVRIRDIETKTGSTFYRFLIKGIAR